MGPFAPPDDLNDYGNFVETVVHRYKGRIHYYQIWNEPNIYPEWGERPVNAAEYAELLKVGYTRAKAVDPDVVVIARALAATIELDRYPHGLADALFLQQLYDAGASPYFDVLAMQGYGLWSGPYDRRMQPRAINFSRPPVYPGRDGAQRGRAQTYLAFRDGLERPALRLAPASGLRPGEPEA